MGEVSQNEWEAGSSENSNLRTGTGMFFKFFPEINIVVLTINTDNTVQVRYRYKLQIFYCTNFMVLNMLAFSYEISILYFNFPNSFG
jgi:hypothetical protein